MSSPVVLAFFVPATALRCALFVRSPQPRLRAQAELEVM